jgi:hypothetical protein
MFESLIFSVLENSRHPLSNTSKNKTHLTTAQSTIECLLRTFLRFPRPANSSTKLEQPGPLQHSTWPSSLLRTIAAKDRAEVVHCSHGIGYRLLHSRVWGSSPVFESRLKGDIRDIHDWGRLAPQPAPLTPHFISWWSAHQPAGLAGLPFLNHSVMINKEKLRHVSFP